IIDLARGLDSGSVDLIVSGHTHSLVNTVVNGIPIVQARSSGAGIAVVDFVRVSGAGGARREVRARIETPFADRVRLDPALVDALRLSQASVSVITDRPVVRFGTELRRTGAEYGLGRRVQRLRLANGKDVDDGRTYTLAVGDFLAAGGSGYAMLQGAPSGEVGVTDLDALIQYLAVLRQPVSAPDDRRFYREGGSR